MSQKKDYFRRGGGHFYPLQPIAKEWWEKELEEYLNTEEHRYDCCGYSEGLECCLEKDWIRDFIRKIIKRTENKEK